MAKRRTAQKTALTPEAQQHRRETLAWAAKRSAERARGLDPGSSEPLTAAMLNQPGELERALSGIKQRFVRADQRYRAAIDNEVMQCMRVAHFLNANLRTQQHILGGKWLDHWRKHKKIKTEALRFVFLQTHNDPKKASLYFRAMYTMFDENVRVEDIPARVTASGGYQALADAHVRFPRNEPDEGEGDNKKPKPSKLKTKHSEGDGEQSKPDNVDETSNEGDGVQKPAPKMNLVATFDEEGQSFLDLPLPCYATVIMHIAAGPGNSRTVTIYHAELGE